MKRFYTAESVTEGRPDKVEYILDDGEGWRELKVRGS